MRYTGPKAKRCRATGMNLYGNEKFDRLHKQYPPGQHGQTRKKKSDYADHLLEKQKIRFTYGTTETQLRCIYAEASSAKDVTGTVLLQLLERRLDNVLFRSGLLNSRNQSRQLVSHGHVLVNGKRLSIPSARLKPGDVITFSEKSLPAVRKLVREHPFMKPDWLDVDAAAMRVQFLLIPARDQIDQSFRENMLVEFYSR